jgi:hypothetical protein
MSGAGPLVGPPASNRFRSPWGLGLEEGEGLLGEGLLGEGLLGEGLLGEGLLGEVELGEGLLCVVVLAL